MTKLTDPIDDQELDRRLYATFRMMMPLLDTDHLETRTDSLRTSFDGLGDEFDVDASTAQVDAGRRRFSTAGASLLAAAAVVTLFVIVGQRDDGTPPPPIPPAQAEQPSALPSATAIPGWYSTIRPLLPDGFDQIVLADSTPQSINFVAFRTDTRQLLDVAMSFEPGFGKKETSDPVTFEDVNGTYKQSASGVWLDTTDDRYVSIRCGLVPIGGGGLGDVGFTNGERDDCGDGFDYLDLDAEAMRSLAANLAANLKITPQNSGPDGALLDASVAPETESAAVEAQIARYVGDNRMTFVMGQFDDVFRAANLSPGLDGPMTTQLSIIHGIYPPRVADSIPTNLPSVVDPPDTRFRVYDGIAVAMVVTDDGTGFHVATSDLDPQHLSDLGELLNQLVVDQAAPSPDSTGIAITDPGRTSESTPVSTMPAATETIGTTPFPFTPEPSVIDPTPVVLPDDAVLNGIEPTCTATTDKMVFKCAIPTFPEPVGTLDYTGYVTAIVDDTSHVSGGCRATNPDATAYLCYIGQRAIDEQTIGKDLLGDQSSRQYVSG